MSRGQKVGFRHTLESRKKIGFAGQGRVVSLQTRKKMSLAQKGHTVSIEARKNMSLAHHGQTVSLEARKRISEKMKGRKLSVETRRRQSLAQRGHGCSDEARLNMRKSHLGKTLTIEHRRKLSELHRGEKSHLWRGGLTSKNFLIRHSLEYKLWREAIFERDQWTCIWCGQKGGTLNADHIKPFALFPELRFAIDNGRTLCESCHKTTDTYLYKAKKFISKED